MGVNLTYDSPGPSALLFWIVAPQTIPSTASRGRIRKRMEHRISSLYCTIHSSFHYTILYYNAIPQHTMLCYTILYYTILCYAMLCYAILYYTILYHTIPYHTIPYHTIPYHTIPYHTILYYTILYYTILYYTKLLHVPFSGLQVALAVVDPASAPHRGCSAAPRSRRSWALGARQRHQAYLQFRLLGGQRAQQLLISVGH